ncbi:Uncharacterized protein TCAP_01470 [Tolypocladium capitatum]|uniref:Uncharacterized protein n=1 Tax=Tolypocladium capitatum TaxID=45235 RepID=A0A2K3QM58_9HYPO|nr:Uncharacterized protein TCAP_01470 [Tolypocladium capitatum]
MSSPAQQGPPSAPRDGREKKGFGRVLSKVKIALTRGESSSSGADKQEPATASKATAPSAAAEARARLEVMEGVTKMARSQLFEQRAKKMAERYGLEIKASDWQSVAADGDDTVLRIDKPIRIRVRRTCHRCHVAFAADKECPGCQHVHCAKCARYPPQRTEAEQLASHMRREAIVKANKENPPIVADYSYTDEGIVLTRPSKTGGQDLVYKKPRQRVRRSCHECQALFVGGSKKCEDCGHMRCTDCPRDPPKKDKYPFGYPGDAFGPSSIPRYECGRCETLFPPDAERGTVCQKCGCEKSDDDPRALPRAVEPERDPEVLKTIQAKLDRLKVA